MAAVSLGLLSWQLSSGRPELLITGLATFVLALQRLNLRFAKLGLSFDLLVGLLNPTEGEILIDGVDLQRLDLDSWQRHLGVVSQDVLFLNDTIAANIAFGMGNSAGPEAIHKAAQAACAEDFIRALPAGYDTLMGEHGRRLSGGQRQRLSRPGPFCASLRS